MLDECQRSISEICDSMIPKACKGLEGMLKQFHIGKSVSRGKM